MYEYLKKLNENLKSNQDLTLKLIFTFSVYLFYLILVRTFGYENVKFLILPFILIGLAVFGSPLLLPLIIKALDKNKSLAIGQLISLLSMVVSIITCICYYIFGSETFINISIITFIITYLNEQFYAGNPIKWKRNFIKTGTTLLAILGGISINKSLNTGSFINDYLIIFCLLFFIFDIVVYYISRKDTQQS